MAGVKQIRQLEYSEASMETSVRVTANVVPIGSLKPHPANPRRGNTDMLVMSLQEHGQYRPIVAQTSTRHILAGNHTWRAAKQLGWTEIAVTWLDADDKTALRVLIADNRTADLATYDNEALATLLRSLPDLAGTGFDRYDLDELEKVFAGSGSEGGATKPSASKPDIHLGAYDLWIDNDVFAGWQISVTKDTKKATVNHLRSLLGFPIPPPVVRVPRKAAQNIIVDAEQVDINTLEPFDGNAREGDIGAIAESLKQFGQFRPIVVNRPTNTILVGNHTWRAAKHLGWKQIAVTWLDVDGDTAKRIVLIDNRATDVASYDDNALLAILTSVTLDGTGFAPEDIDDLLNDVKDGRSHRNPAKTSDIKCRVGDWSWKVDRDTFDLWNTDADMYTKIVASLQLPADCWTTEGVTQ